MRIVFRNLGQAELVIKTCMSTLKEATGLSSDQHIPSQRLRNEFAKGLGYSSYTELQNLSASLNSAWEPPDEEDFREAMVRGFEKAMKELRTNGVIGHYHEDAPVIIAGEASDKLEEVILPDVTAAKDEWTGLAALGSFHSPETAEKDKAGLLRVAEEALRSAIDHDPRLLDSRLALATIEWDRQNYTASRDLAQQALDLTIGHLKTDAPEAFEWGSDDMTRAYLQARHTLGLSLMMLGSKDAARREFEEVLKRDKSDRFGVQLTLNEMATA